MQTPVMVCIADFTTPEGRTMGHAWAIVLELVAEALDLVETS
jgi:succinyl-CoA synthetase alpha subunit